MRKPDSVKRDVQGAEPGLKDHHRIAQLMEKGDDAVDAAKQMAALIKNPDKAVRRATAAILAAASAQAGDRSTLREIAMVFMMRSVELEKPVRCEHPGSFRRWLKAISS